MKPSQAYDRLSPDEFERWFARRMRRQLIGNFVVIGLCVLAALIAVPYFTIRLFTAFYGPESWASGAFMSGLVLYAAHHFFRYRDQERSDDFDE